MTLPFALGCPSCPHTVTVPATDPDAVWNDLNTHLMGVHHNYEWVADPRMLRGVAVELTEEEADR